MGKVKGIKLNVGDQQDLNFKLALAEKDMKRLGTLAGAGGVANDYA